MRPTSSHRRCSTAFNDLTCSALPHAALLVFLAAAARAGIVAADFGFQVADRFDFLIGLGAGDGRLLLAFDFAGRLGVFLDRLRLDPRAADETFVELFHLEDQVGHVVADAGPHAVEQQHAFALVFDLRIDLGVAAETDAGAQVVHREQMLFPVRVEDLEEQSPLHPPHFGAEVVFDNLRNFAFGCFAIETGQLVVLDFGVAGCFEPSGQVVELAVVVR